MTTQPKGSQEPSEAWVNFQITTSKLINFVQFDLEFTSDEKAEAEGLMSLYVNGTKRSVVDEVYTLPGMETYVMPTPGELQPGTHVVSFRLDQFGDPENGPSSFAVASVAMGFGGFVNIADLNVDGAVDVSDLLILLANWGACPRNAECPADLNGDGAVDVSDLLILLSNWG